MKNFLNFYCLKDNKFYKMLQCKFYQFTINYDLSGI